MNIKIQILSLFITISFFSCNSAAKNQIIPISNINTDFSNSEKLEFKPFNKYEIMGYGQHFIDDSILWHFGEEGHSFGSCYDLNTGERLSTVAMIGKAAYEFTSLPNPGIVGDSVQFYTHQNIIKTFSKKDIIENKPMNERKFSVTTTPDSICVSRSIIKLPNGSVLATIPPFRDFEKPRYEKYGINKKSVAIFNNNEANSYETIKYDSFYAGTENGSKVDINDKIKFDYSTGHIGIKGNDMAVFSVNNQFMLYTFDINSGNVIKEKRYSKLQGGMSSMFSISFFRIYNDMNLYIDYMISNDKYILCSVKGYFSEKDKELKVKKEAIFVFDWDLNPIKRFDMPYRANRDYIISNDCSSVYFSEHTDDGLTLSKADLNI